MRGCHAQTMEDENRTGGGDPKPGLEGPDPLNKLVDLIG